MALLGVPRTASARGCGADRPIKPTTQPHAHGPECAGRTQASAGLVAFLAWFPRAWFAWRFRPLQLRPAIVKKSPRPPLGEHHLADSRGVRRGAWCAGRHRQGRVWLERGCCENDERRRDACERETPNHACQLIVSAADMRDTTP